jgi:primosomal protein N'
MKKAHSNRVEVSIILPFADLGFVIVDEEHEQTFKQIDPAPDIMPAMHRAKVFIKLKSC